MSAPVEMHVEGASTRTVRVVIKVLCGHACSACTISLNHSGQDGVLAQAYQYLIPKTRYENAHIAGIVRSRSARRDRPAPLPAAARS